MDRERIIQKYLGGTLSSDEKAWFDQQYVSDSAFKEEVEEAVRLKRAIVQHKKETLRQSLSALEQDYAPKTRFPLFRYAIVASVVLLFGITAYLMLGRPARDGQQLYAQYFVAYQNVVYPIERTSDADTNPEETAFRLYERGKYALAYQQFDSLYIANAKPYLLFYQAICAMENGELADAESRLLEHQKQKDDFHDQRKWYLALIYLKTDRTEQAKTLFAELSSSDFKPTEASKILDALR